MENSSEPPKKLTWAVWANYIGDWVLTLGLAGLFLALSGPNIEGFRRRFSLDDQTIQYPYTLHERVPNWLLVVLAFVVPLLLMPVINLLTIRSLWDLHNSTLGLILSLALTGSLTNILKLTTGRPRPDLLARCLPTAGSQNPPVFGLVDSSICTQTSTKIMNDGWASFISGHSSLSFAGLGFLSLYLAGKLHLFDQRGQTIKAWAFAIPLFGATVISITRTMDYRHHWQDVGFGLTLGLATAYFSYRQYYPSLETLRSHYPFTPRHLMTVDRENTEMDQTHA